MKNLSKLFLNAVFLASATFFFGGTASAQASNEILIVADQMTSCRGIVAGDCLQTKHLDEREFSILRENIEGFKFVPGYFYVLDVRRTANGKLRLRSVLAREKSKNSNSDVSNFYGTQWNLKEINGQPYSGRAFVRFDSQKNSAGGNGGCNAFGGNLTVNDKNIEISRILSTKMYCQGASDVESEFLGLLEKADSYEIRGGELILLQNKRRILVFRS